MCARSKAKTAAAAATTRADSIQSGPHWPQHTAWKLEIPHNLTIFNVTGYSWVWPLWTEKSSATRKLPLRVFVHFFPREGLFLFRIDLLFSAFCLPIPLFHRKKPCDVRWFSRAVTLTVEPEVERTNLIFLFIGGKSKAFSSLYWFINFIDFRYLSNDSWLSCSRNQSPGKSQCMYLHSQ